MINLTKPEINSLILNYLTNESFIYTAYVFKNESKDDIKSVRKDVTLDKILSYGVQYMYGVEHYKDGKINICNGIYSLDRLHLCDVVVKKKKRKIKKEEIEINNNQLQSSDITKFINNLPTEKSTKMINLTSSSLSPCKPCDLVDFTDEYLFLYSSSYLYTFKYGNFTGMKNINLLGMLYKDDILVMYDNNKITFHNTFNLKSRSVLHKCIRILYDGIKFVCLNYYNTVSYYTRDGVKVLDNLFVFGELSDGCIFGSSLFAWSSTGKICLINTKTQEIKFFNGTGKNISGYYTKDSIVYIVYEDGTIGIYTNNEELIIKNEDTDLIFKYKIIRTNIFIIKYSDKLITVYENDNNWKISKTFKTDENILNIYNFKELLLVVFRKKICIYDGNLYLIEEFQVDDNIKDVAVNGNEICVLLDNGSPLLINVQ